MAQQQQHRRDEFANAPRTQDRDRDDVRKNDQSDRSGDQFGTDPVAQYTYYGTTVAVEYGAPATGVPAGAYGMPDYGTNVGGTYDPAGAGYDNTTGVAGYGSGATTGDGTTGVVGQWGQDATAGGGGGGGQWGQDAATGGGGGGADVGIDMNRNMDKNMNKGREQK